MSLNLAYEVLSPRRCAAMTEPYRIGQLVDTLAEPEVFTTLLDTGHLLDSGYDLEAFLSNWPFSTEELQLKGSHSTPPDFSFGQWLRQLPFQPAVLCVEHRQSIALSEFEQLISAIRLELFWSCIKKEWVC